MNKFVIGIGFILLLLFSAIVSAPGGEPKEGDFDKDNKADYGIVGEDDVTGSYSGGKLTITSGTFSELDTASKGIEEANIASATVKLGGNPYPAQNLDKVSVANGVIKGTAGAGAVIGDNKIPAGMQFEMNANGKIKIYGISTAQNPDISIGDASFKTGGDGFEYDPATKTVKPLGKSSFTLADGSNIGLRTPNSYFILDNGQVKEAYLEKDSYYKTSSNLGSQYIRAAQGNIIIKPDVQGIPAPPNDNTAALNIDTSSGKPVYNINTTVLKRSGPKIDLDIRISNKQAGQENPNYVLQFGTSSESGDTTLATIGSSRYNQVTSDIIFNTPTQRVTIDEEATNIDRVDTNTRELINSQKVIPAPGWFAQTGRWLVEAWNNIDMFGSAVDITLEEKLRP